MKDEERLQMITEQLLIVRDNLFRGMSKSMQKLQAQSINEVLELPNFTQSPQPQDALPAFWLNEQGQLSATLGFAERHSIGQKIVPLYTTPPQPEERNFCQRCGKRTADLTVIHTCTPPQRKPLTDDEIWEFWCSRPEVLEGEDDSMEAEFVTAVRAVLAAHNIKENT